MTSSTIPLGVFPLVTSEDDIDGAYHDDRAIEIQFSGSHINDNYVVSAMFTLHAGLPHYLGHSVEPNGYGLRIFKQAEDSLWVEVTQRSTIK